MYNIKDLGWNWSPAIRLKIVVQTDGIDFGMYSQRPFEWYDTPSKAENELTTRKTLYFPR